MLELAGEIGDGALINASNPKDFEVAIPIIKQAMEKVGKKSFDVGAYTAMSIDMDEKKARNAAKIVAAFIAAGSPPDLLKRHNLDLNNVAKIKEALGRFDFKTVGGLVGDAEIDAFTIAGTPDMVKQKCEDLAKAGVTHLRLAARPRHDHLHPPTGQVHCLRREKNTIAFFIDTTAEVYSAVSILLIRCSDRFIHPANQLGYGGPCSP